jgi:type I restriction enzyme S subunit
MGLKPGYKETEIGVIPKDWEVSSLGGCLADRPTYGINAPAVPYSDRLPVYLRITDITEEGYFEPDPPVSVRSESSKNYWLNEGDIVFARTGASVGKSYQYRSADGPLVYAGFLIRVRPDDQRLLPTFLAAYVTTGRYWQWVRLMSMRSGQPGINGNEYSQLPISLPPLCEQRAIATALSDVDALLEGLDRLIAKKRDLKQAAMQQLLTGQTRLPGFEGEWEEKRIGALADIDPENLSSTTASDYYFNYISLEQVDSGNLLGFTEVTFRTSPSRARLVLRHNDVLVATVRPNLKSHLHFKSYVQNAVCSTGFAVIRVKPKSADSGFIFSHFFAEVVNDQINKILAGSNYPAINSSDVKSIEIPCPPTMEEQAAITTILMDMDAEIEALDQRRVKTAALKQAMMQELLTGHTRLVEPHREGVARA